MNKICEICENHNNFQYLIKENYYSYLNCYVCNKTINICYDCKKYIWIKPTSGNIVIPQKYKRVIDQLCKYSHPKCKKCWNRDIRSDFSYCYNCGIFTSKKNILYCSHCNSSNCNDCNKEKCISCNADNNSVFVLI